MAETTAPVIAGRSPAKLAIARFKKDKVAMTGLFISLFFFAVAFLATPILAILNRDAYVIDRSAINLDYFNYPLGPWGGISTEHWLGVEPGVGRDVFARLLLGARTSITIAVITSVLSIALGMVVGVISGYFKGKVDNAIGRLIDLLLAFPTFFMLIAVARPLAEGDLADQFGPDPVRAARDAEIRNAKNLAEQIRSRIAAEMPTSP